MGIIAPIMTVADIMSNVTTKENITIADFTWAGINTAIGAIIIATTTPDATTTQETSTGVNANIATTTIGTAKARGQRC